MIETNKDNSRPTRPSNF